MELVDRFRYLMKLNQLTPSAFADEIGVQRSSVSHVLSGRNKPSLEFIQKILNRFPKVDAAWLINGTASIGSKTKNTDPPTKTEAAPQEKVEEQADLREKEGALSVKAPLGTSSGKAIQRILVFYTDQTFEEFSPTAIGKQE